MGRFLDPLNPHKNLHKYVSEHVCHPQSINFFQIERFDSEEIRQTIVDLCKTRLPQKYSCNAVEDIQIITPMKNGNIGTPSVNTALQEALNPNQIFLERAGVRYVLGDKVMKTKNNYDKNIFNGDLGYIIKVNLMENCLTVSFDTGEVTYDITQLDELTLAYAMTVHKS